MCSCFSYIPVSPIVWRFLLSGSGCFLARIILISAHVLKGFLCLFVFVFFVWIRQTRKLRSLRSVDTAGEDLCPGQWEHSGCSCGRLSEWRRPRPGIVVSVWERTQKNDPGCREQERRLKPQRLWGSLGAGGPWPAPCRRCPESKNGVEINVE